MSKELGLVLQQSRQAANMTQQQVADAVGVSRTAVGQWESGTHEPSTSNLILVCEALGIELDAATKGELRSSSETGKSAAAAFSFMKDVVKSRFRNQHPNKSDLIDYFFTVTASTDGSFSISKAVFMEYPMPTALRGSKEAYAIGVPDNYLSPKYEKDEVIYINPKLRPKPGDYVLCRTGKIEQVASTHGGPGFDVEKCYMGRFLGFDPFVVLLQQFQPARELAIQIDEKTELHRICTPAEMMG